MVKRINFKLLSVFFFSTTLLAYELYVMRIFSVGSWSNFGSLVISTALLGFGLAGTLLTFIIKKVSKNPNRWHFYSSLFFIPAMAFGHILAQQVPFEPTLIGSSATQFFWIGMYYLIYGVPFFLGALFIGVSFIVLSSQIYKLYFWNMIGSGLGGLFILFLMYLLPPQLLLIPLLFTAAVAATLSAIRWNQDTRRITIKSGYLVSITAALLISLVSFTLAGAITISQYKSVSYARHYEDAKMTHHSYSPAGEIYVYSSSLYHSAPGMSDNAAANITEIPKQKFWGMYIDGNGPIVIMGKPLEEENIFLDYLPIAAPYRVMDKPRVLLVNLGGGISTQSALYHGAKKVDIVDPNPELVTVLKDDPVIAKFTGHLLDNPRISIHKTNPRAYCLNHKDAFDIVEISLVDSVGLSQTGGYPVDENFTYTEEAIGDYMAGLTDRGVLSITVWNRLKPARNVLKILSTAVFSLRKQGIKDPGKHLFVFDYLNSTATVLIKKTPFRDEEIAKLQSYVHKMSFNSIFYPGFSQNPKNDLSLDQILTHYQTLFEKNPKSKPLDFDSSYFYHLAMLDFLFDNGKEVFSKYIFDVSPMTDNRPYYTAYLKLKDLGLYLNHPQAVSEEWGYLILMGILIQSIIFALLIILLPVIGRWKELFSGRKGTLGVIVYFACLGLGFMLIEMFLIQKLVFFLADPIFSISIVITAMLIISGIGSLLSRRLAKTRIKVVRIATLGIVLSVLFYMFGLSPLLSFFLGAPMIIKALVVIMVIFPAAFFLGMPFPNGLNALTEKRPDILPWAWGMNGALSVTGSVLGRLISVSFGFTAVLLLAMLLYGLAGTLYPANEQG